MHNRINKCDLQAAFIAGVQAQVMTFIIPLPRSALQRTANLFAFLGLVFEIAGTFLGRSFDSPSETKQKQITSTATGGPIQSGFKNHPQMVYKNED